MHSAQQPPDTLTTTDQVEAFIERWRDSGGLERANYQLFLTELCQLLDLPGPEPAGPDPTQNAYVFERRVDIHHSDGSVNRGYIDLYRRGHFVLEAKQVSEQHQSSRWDKAMLRAAAQADSYIRALPTDEGRPPFLLTCDVGRTIEVYSEFSRSGATYVPFPDPRSHRIHLEDLRDEQVRQRLVGIWTNPDALDPARYAARVTRELSKTLAQLARALEKDGYHVERVAHFIKRCLFTMFCEDVDLLPRGAFTGLLEKLHKTPQHFRHAIASLWQTMNDGGYSGVLNHELLRFNGNLFRDIDPIALDQAQISLLIDAARHDWSQVEPAIFGTLLERALDPEERHKLGAHYTPRAYVERLVMPTIIDPLRDEWKTVQAAAAALENQGKEDQAMEEIRSFHHRLCEIRILDPACGSGNFLYVTLEHMKRLEGEVLGTLTDLGAGQNLLEMQGNTVDPHQFLGLEINPRAAAIAEIVLWIGYLQWHFRTHGHINPPQPVIKAFANIECRDAVLDYDRVEYKIDEQTGRPVMRWDGKTYKKSPTTGEDIPDESAQEPVEVYVNPRKAEWPETDFVVGNPPFIGAKRMRTALGDGYVQALRETYKGALPNSADFVMYWWHTAAELVSNGHINRFGLITTNSIKQVFNYRVVEKHLQNTQHPVSILFAISDHPWVDSSDGAAVRISMTVASSGSRSGELLTIVRETGSDEEAPTLEFNRQQGKVFANLSIGADVLSAGSLQACQGLCSVGIMVHGADLIIDEDRAVKLGLSESRDLHKFVRPYVNGRDLAQSPRGLFVIDFYGLQPEEIKLRFPAAYQWILERVKPARDQKTDRSSRDKWWLPARPRPEWRSITRNLDKFIASTRVSKHRVFGFLGANYLPDDKVVGIGMQSSMALGALSSRIHTLWALRTGAFLGAGNDACYNYSSCFETFPFPDPHEASEYRIKGLAEQLDSHRKQRQEQHPGLTMTGMYNVLEKLRRQALPGSNETPLTDKEKAIHEQGLVSVLRELHDDLDRAVFEAYGWEDLAEKLVGRPGATTPWPEKPEDQAEAEEELLQRLVDLNHQRAAEEAQGKIRWLRPEYQAPEESPEQGKLETTSAGTKPTSQPVNQPTKKLTWPKTLQEQIRAVRDQLETAPMDAATLAANFKRKPEKSVTQVLHALSELGMVRTDENGAYRMREG